MSKRSIRASDIISDLRAGYTDNVIMQRHRLSARALEGIFAKLVQAGLLSQSELDSRLDSSLRSVVLEVYRCPACDCVQVEKFDECPRCGVVVAKYKPKLAPPVVQEPAVVAPVDTGTYKLIPSPDGRTLVIEGLNPELQRRLMDAVSRALK